MLSKEKVSITIDKELYKLFQDTIIPKFNCVNNARHKFSSFMEKIAREYAETTKTNYTEPEEYPPDHVYEFIERTPNKKERMTVSDALYRLPTKLKEFDAILYDTDYMKYANNRSQYCIIAFKKSRDALPLQQWFWNAGIPTEQYRARADEIKPGDEDYKFHLYFYPCPG